MATTIVNICNAALSRLGEKGTITSIYPPEGSAEAEDCAHFYPIALQTLLSARNWGFARRTRRLSRLMDNNDEWAYVYAFPNDCMAVHAVMDASGSPVVHEVQFNGTRKTICCNVAGAVLEYTEYNKDPAQFPFLFVDALTWKLAALLAGSIIKGDAGMKMAQQCEQYALAILTRAQEVDANQSRHHVEHRVPWLEGR